MHKAIGIIAVAISLLCGPAAAQTLPAIYSVTGVQDDDVLNVRREPTVQSDIIGVLEPDAADIEVVALSENGWGLLNTGEGSGWVNMRFMELVSAFAWPPATLSCFGTEPFWEATAVEFRGALEVTLNTFDDAPLEGVAHPGSSANSLDRWSFFGRDASGSGIAASLRREQCSDGMSDRAYGISIELLLEGTSAHLSGCCTQN